MGPEDLEKFEYELNKPLDGQMEKASESMIESEQAAFLAVSGLAGMHGAI